MRSQKDFFSGLMFMGVGMAFALGSTQYAIGSGARMGPGYFPLVLGVLLAILGFFIALNGIGIQAFLALLQFLASAHRGLPVPNPPRFEVASGEKVGPIAWRPLVCVIAANLVFGAAVGGVRALGIPVLGLIVGVYALTIIAAFGSDSFRLGDALLVATVLAALSYVVFVALLKLHFPVWPAFLVA